jgi:hypothetical protein
MCEIHASKENFGGEDQITYNILQKGGPDAIRKHQGRQVASVKRSAGGSSSLPLIKCATVPTFFKMRRPLKCVVWTFLIHKIAIERFP